MSAWLSAVLAALVLMMVPAHAEPPMSVYIAGSFAGRFEPVDPNAPGPKLYIKTSDHYADGLKRPVLYTEMRADGWDGPVVRQRIYEYSDDGLRAFEPLDGAALVGAHDDAARIDALQMADLKSFPAGCHLRLQASSIADHWRVETTRATCHIKNERSGQMRHIDLAMSAGRAGMWLMEQGFTPDGEVVFGSGVPLRFVRVSE